MASVDAHFQIICRYRYFGAPFSRDAWWDRCKWFYCSCPGVVCSPSQKNCTFVGQSLDLKRTLQCNFRPDEQDFSFLSFFFLPFMFSSVWKNRVFLFIFFALPERSLAPPVNPIYCYLPNWNINNNVAPLDFQAILCSDPSVILRFWNITPLPSMKFHLFFDRFSYSWLFLQLGPLILVGLGAICMYNIKLLVDTARNMRHK